VKIRVAGAFVAAAVIAVSVATVSSARAQTNAAPTLTLEAQDPWTPLNGMFTMRLRTAGSVDGLRLAITVHEPVITRSAFDATITSGSQSLGSTLRLLQPSLGELPSDAAGLRTVAFGLNDLNLRRSGVYPVEVQLRDGNDVVTGFVTHIIAEDPNAPPAKPIDVSWIWPLVTEPALGLDANANAALVDELASNGRLGRQAALIGADTDVPLTLSPNPETLETWSSLANADPLGHATGVAAVRAAPTHHQVLSAPYVSLDLPSLMKGGLGTLLTNELQRGGDVLQDFFGTHFDPSTAMPGPLDPDSLDAFRAAARTRLVVDGNALEPFTERLTPSRPALLSRSADDSTNAATVLATDPGLERFLDGTEPPALRAARLLAALTVIASEQPSVARGVAFANPADWEPSEQFVNAVLAGLRGNPFLRPVTVDTQLAEVPRVTVGDEPDGPPVVRTLAPVTIRKAPVTVPQYYEAVANRRALVSLFGESDVRVVRADRAMLTVLSESLETPAGRRRARDLLHSIGQSGRDFLTHIHVEGRSTVTLTSSRAQIPLTFRNDADRQVGIHVVLQSNRVQFPDGADRDVVLAPGKNHTVRIAVETRSSGTYPLVMNVTTADGLPIQTSEVTVRSSFVSGVGIFLTVGALAFLALWWGWDIRRRRRRRRAA
jgi:Family of unknown function (DUF6049)